MRFLSSIRGNTALETALFTPLALLFIFGAVEAGYVLSDKAAVSEALRAGLNSAVYFSARAPVTDWEDDARTLTASPRLRSLVENVAKEISKNVADARGGRDDFSVVVEAVVLTIDPLTGARLPAVNTAYRTSLLDSGFDIRSAAPSFPYRAAEAFISQRLQEDSAVPSVFATAIPTLHDRLGLEPSTSAFLSYSILLYAEVTAAARGIGGGASKSFMGSMYALEEQELLQLRSQLD